MEDKDSGDKELVPNFHIDPSHEMFMGPSDRPATVPPEDSTGQT